MKDYIVSMNIYRAYFGIKKGEKAAATRAANKLQK